MKLRALGKAIKNMNPVERRKSLLSLLLSMASLGLIAAVTFSWFASNNLVSSGGISITVESIKPKITYTLENNSSVEAGDDPIDLSCLKRPGSTVDLLITVENIGNVPFTVDSLGLTGGAETANAKGVCLGTQLRAALQPDGAALPLATLTDDGPVTDVILFDENDTEKSVTLAKGERITFPVKIEFVDTGESQDDYKHFGLNGDGVCARKVFVNCTQTIQQDEPNS